jgi:hypothetical protein
LYASLVLYTELYTVYIQSLQSIYSLYTQFVCLAHSETDSIYNQFVR